MKKRSSALPDTKRIQQKTEVPTESSRHLEQLFDEMPSGYALHEIICDPGGKPVDYRFLEVNPTFERLTGLVAGEVLGKRALEVIPGLEPFWIETYGRVALKDQPERFENYSQTLDKTFSVVAYCPQHGQFAVLIEDITERKQVEEALKESAGNMQAILDSNLDAVFLIELDGTIVAANQALAERFGRNTEKLIGSKAYDLVDKKLADQRWKYIDQVITTGKPTRFEDERDGLTIESSIYPVLDEQGKVVRLAIFSRDVSDRKKAEEQILRSEEELKKAQSYAHVGSWIWNIKAGRLEWSDEMFNIFGISKESFSSNLQEVVASAIHPGDREKVEASNSSVAHQGKPIPLEYRILRPDGTERVVWAEAGELEKDSEGNPALLRGIVMDITERKQAEEELREERQHLAGILEGTNAGTWEWNVQTGEAIFNDRWAEIIGYSLDELSPISIETWMHYAHPDDVKVSDELLQKHFRGEMDYYEFESRMRHKDGTWVWIMDRGKVISWTEDGKPLIMMGTHQDITKSKRAEEALQKSQDLLNATGQVAQVGGWEIDTSGNTLAWTEETFHIHELEPGNQPDVDTTINFYHPDDRERVTSAVEQAVATGEPFDLEARLITAHGNQIWVRSSGQSIKKQGKLVGVRGSIQNITERKNAEEALQQSERRYRERATELETIMDIAPVALWMAQDPACHVIVGNRTANELHRIQPDQNASLTPAMGQQLLHDQLKILHDGVEITANKLPLQVCASKGIEIRDFESQIVFEDGSVIHEIGNAKPLLDENGQPRGAVGAFMDITGLKRVEEELRHRAEELDALQKTVFDITAAQTLPGLLESIVERACQLVGAPGGGLYLADPVRQEVRCDVSYNTPNNYVGVVLKYGEGVAGRVAQTGQPFSVDDYKNWAGRAQSFELERPFSTVLGVPMLWGGQVYGVIDVLHFEEGRSFTQADMDLLNIFAGHATIAIENSRLLEASQAGEAQVRILSTRLAEAEENERRRIARELHDQVGQSLSALSINMNIMHSQVPEYLPGFKRRLDDSLMLIDQTTDHIRHLMSELRPAVLDDYGLKAALDWAVGSIAKRTSLKFQVEGECNRFPSRVEIALFRIAQEALGNITRHAHARNVQVGISQDGPEMSMTISDDGVGFDPASVEATEQSGWGLRLMAERAESIGANLQVESTPGKGTCITVSYHDDNPTGG